MQLASFLSKMVSFTNAVIDAVPLYAISEHVGSMEKPNFCTWSHNNLYSNGKYRLCTSYTPKISGIRADLHFRVLA